MSPPYRLVLPAAADREDWLAARRSGIGSSDVAAAMGVSSHGTARHVYHDKRGELPLDDEPGEAALWGTLFEDTVAREWARRNRSIVRRVGLIARRDAPHRMCTLDRRVDECPLARDTRERCALEVKCRSAWVAGRWKRGIPDDVLAQVLWQIHVTGHDHVHVACLIGGNDYRQYVVRRAGNEQLIDDIVTVADRLWAAIQAGHPPVLTGSEPVDVTLELIDALNPLRDGYADLDEYPAKSVAAIGDLLEYESARLEAKAAEQRKDAAKLRLIDALGPHRAAVLNKDVAYQLRDVERSSVDLEQLAEEFPDAYAACVSTKTTRTLAIDRRHRLEEPI